MPEPLADASDGRRAAVAAQVGPRADFGLPPRVTLREVGPRDGLQVEAPLPVADRVALIRALAAAGLRHVEVGSFVSPRAVPAMAGTADVIAALGRPADLTVTALVPNERGARDALAAGVDELTVTASASEAYGRRNVGMTRAQQRDQVERIVALAGDVPVDAVVSCAFGSPDEGDIEPAEVARVGEELLAVGAGSVAYADTTGLADPGRVAAVLEHTGPDVGLHVHETRGTGLVNVVAALQLGVTRFDTSVGGLGGSPFAADAAGNVATEGVVSLLERMGLATGVDLDALLEVCVRLRALVGHPLPSPLAARRIESAV